MVRTEYPMQHNHLYIVVDRVFTNREKIAFRDWANANLDHGFAFDSENFSWRQNVAGTQCIISIPYKDGTTITKARAEQLRDRVNTMVPGSVVKTYDDAVSDEKANLDTLLASKTWALPIL